MAASPEQIKEILRLRERKVAPKQIARKLKLRPAEVTAVIRADAEAHPDQYRRDLLPLRECLINVSAAERFFPTQPGDNGKKMGWLKVPGKSPDKANDPGMAQVIVTRDEGSRYSVSSYLIDYWCLGVKDAMGPRRMNRADYLLYLDVAYTDAFGEDYQEISLHQAQALVFGATDYSKQLGFDPHRDFERAKVALGDREAHLPQLDFGKDGKPMYFSGPYDNPDKVLATLEKSVGKDNFDFVLASQNTFNEAADEASLALGW